MYRIIIVDDEPYIVDSLFNFLQFEQPLELDVYKAYSAVEALKLLNNVKFDIVITDISMPEMDGMELMKVVKSNWPHCKVIFLTGYSEFEYVYTAIKYEGVKYILKCESYKEIGQVLKDTISELDAIINVEELMQKVNLHNEKVQPYLQQQVMLDIINNEFMLDDQNTTFFNEVKIPLRIDVPLMLVMLYINQLSEGSSETNKSDIYSSIYLIGEEYFKPFFCIVQTVCEPLVLLWVLQPIADNFKFDNEYSEDMSWEKARVLINGNIENIQNECLDKLKITTSYLFDSKREYFNSIHQRFDNMKRFLFNYEDIDLEMKIINMEHITSDILSLEDRKQIPLLSSMDLLEISRFETAFGNSKKEDAVALLNKLTQKFKKSKSMHYNPSLESYFKIAMVLYSYINRRDLSSKIAFKIPMYKLFSIEQHKSWEAAAEYLKNLAEAIYDLQSIQQDTRMTEFVEKVMLYINEHISEDLSLIKLSEVMYFNPSYLSMLFKQITGMNLMSYINRIRIEKAKELLETTNVKITDLVGQIGCNSSSYFTQFFKREVGISPHDYREQHLKGNSKGI